MAPHTNLMKIKSNIMTALAGCLALAFSALPVRAEVQGDTILVGPDEQHTTINSALASIPAADFDANVIVQIRAGTYEPFDTDPKSVLNGKPSRTKRDKRLIIQAAPGEEVVIRHAKPFPSLIRESHVTVQGIKFTGIESNPTAAYLTIGTPGYETPTNQRGGIIVQNCEFVGARGLAGLVDPQFDREEEGVDFSFAFVRNAVMKFESHFEIPGRSALPQFHGGNLYADWGGLGGQSIFRPNTRAGDGARWFLNNTLATRTGSLTGVLRLGEGPWNQVVFSNNVTFWASPVENQIYQMFDTQPTDSKWPVSSHNLCFQETPLNWARLIGTSYASVGQWMKKMEAMGGQDGETLESDPQFVNAAAGDFRLKSGSPACKCADSSAWQSALKALGIEAQLSSYWNPLREKGFQTGPMENLGAMKTAL